jgi:single-strand DNA-binding protein
MTDIITVTGLVATVPRIIVTSEGLNITSFRLASTQRKYSKADEAWVDGETNWYTITGFRQLAVNAASSIKKGDRVVVTGRLRIREWQNGEKSGMNVEIDADALGHDLLWGTSSFSRTVTSSTDAGSADPASIGTGGSDAAITGIADGLQLEPAASSDATVPF